MDSYYYNEPYECPGVKDFRIEDKRLKETITKEELERYPVLQTYIDAEEEELKSGVKNNKISENMSAKSMRIFMHVAHRNELSSDSSSTDYISDDYEEDDNAEDENMDDFASKTDAILTIDEKEQMDQIDCWISIKGYKDIKKQVVQRGLPLLDMPRNGDICVINFIGMLQNGKIVDSAFNCKVYVGHQTISEGLDIVLKTMYIDECCRVNLDSSYAFNNKEKIYNVPSGTPIQYVIKLINIQKKSAKTRRQYQEYQKQSKYPK